MLLLLLTLLHFNALLFSSPDTATFVQKLESISKEKLENKDNRSFIVKYVSDYFLYV